MNTQDEKQETIHSSAHNPFPEPQTIPSGWDTNAILLAPQPVTNEPVEKPVKSEDN